MEEDLKKIEEFIEGIEECGLNDCGKKHLDFNLLRNLLKAYKEAENQLDLDYVDNNYIPKSKVKEKIEEIDEKIKYENNEKVLIWLHKQKRVLQSLLEEE